jgi:hypothetical protein
VRPVQPLATAQIDGSRVWQRNLSSGLITTRRIHFVGYGIKRPGVAEVVVKAAAIGRGLGLRAGIPASFSATTSSMSTSEASVQVLP